MTPRGWFVTGTDTGIGKTFVSTALIHSLVQMGYRVAGMKPVASGCEQTPEGLRNEDALMLRQASNVQVPYEITNPFSFAEPVAPHIAAEQEGRPIRIKKIQASLFELQNQSDLVIVEGVGGWEVPLNENATVASLAEVLELPVILVVGMRLGCINHALLTAHAIKLQGLQLAGWVANSIEPDMPYFSENIAAIQARIDTPFLGNLPYLAGQNALFDQSFLDCAPLF